MTVDTRPVPTRAWTPRVAVQLAVLASAAFVYVTAEMVPVAALPEIASDLRVSEAVVGTLLASYALVAAVTTVPLVRLTPHLAAAPHLDADPGVFDCLPIDFGPGPQLRGAGRRTGPVCADPRIDVVGDRADRRPAGARQPYRACHHRRLCRHDTCSGGGQPADGGDERAVGLAAGRRGGHGRGGIGDAAAWVALPPMVLSAAEVRHRPRS